MRLETITIFIMNRFAKIGFLTLILTVLVVIPFALAADYSKDLSLSASDVRVPAKVKTGTHAILYATVWNHPAL